MKEQQFPVFVNREISWTRFNERVLEEAENKANPLCERLTFASIYQTNMDEFFMVRVGSLIDQMEADPMDTDGKTNLTPKQQLDAIFERVAELIPRRDAVYEELMAEVEEYGIRLVNFQKISKKESEHLEDYFMKNMLALMEPNVVGKKQMFPFLKSNSIYAVAVLETKTGKERIGIIPCDTGVFPRLVEVSEGTYILSEDLILHYLPRVFEGYKIKAKSLIRITRNADIDPDALYDMDLDWREFMEEIIKKRRKLAPVRLELSRQLEEKIIDVLCAYLDIDREQVFYYHEPLDLSFVFQLQDKLRSYTNLFYPRRIPQKSPALDTKRSILAQVKEEDKLLFYPYNSITPFLQMLDEAAADEDVISIRMTLYRVARQSKIIEALVEAAENGKEVLVLVELKARFDEENNIGWSRRLEAAGCRVIYGLPGYKVHSKLCLITRREETGNVYYTQIGTGNYNEKTARLYTDLSLLTANQEIGQDAMKVFQALTRGETVESSKTLLVAPKCLQNRIVEMIEEQIEIQKNGGEGYIGIKVNSVTDKLLMEKLIEASQAGVKVDMVVRGICCLVPGVPGLTDNIRVVSVVGRFLEHARIYIFGKPGEDGKEDKIYIASADFMTRNTLKRVEVAAPILSPALKKRLRTFFDLMMSDNQQAREMANDGTYYRIRNDKPDLNSQEFFYDQAYREAEQGEEHEGGISVDEAVASAAVKEAEKAKLSAASAQSAPTAASAISEAGRTDHITLSSGSGSTRN
ncbi:MAG: polyphosphate kinase 1 [Firmicutes bacterium]|nr:polyphosphate kinase 1 [Bacillota bacterium]